MIRQEWIQCISKCERCNWNSKIQSVKVFRSTKSLSPKH